MKRMIVLCFAGAIFSCNTKTEKPGVVTEEIIEADSTVANERPRYNPETVLYIWHTTLDYKKVKNPSLPAAGITSADSLVLGLNEYYENIFLEKVKQGGDTLYTTIKDNLYLGSQMGTSGAEVYLADVVLNLTSVPGIRYVSIDMDSTEHISPGTWEAKDFYMYKEATK